MQENSDKEWRKQRLSDLAKAKGGNASLGRLLGFRDGAYVGQMISGLRPITEKLVEKIQRMHGLHSWFEKGAAQSIYRAEENITPYLIDLTQNKDESEGWPFTLVTEEEWKTIPKHKRDVIEEQVMGMVAAERASKRAA